MFENLEKDFWQLTIPVVAAVIGWFTNWVAIKMMFHPLEFIGIKPFLGWQGIVPANAVRLARTGLELVTSSILKVPQLFEDFDAKALVDQESDNLKKLVRKALEEKALAQFPQMWNALSPQIKEQVFKIAEDEVQGLSIEVFHEAAHQIEELVDVRRIVTEAVKNDKRLMNDTFLEVGQKEFKFIEYSGFWFGLVFGVPQLVLWLAFPASWTLPLFGFLVGYATNWLALYLIFEPKTPKKVLGITFQGLFHRRQKEIALRFGDIVAERVFNPDNLFKEISTGDPRKKLLSIVEGKADALIAKYQKHPMAAMVMKPELAAELKRDILRDVEQEMFRPNSLVQQFINKSDKIRKMLQERMAVMEPEGYENVLRPAFKQDEWKLIIAGAVLGAAVGLLQATWYL
ncbi:MAG TPA: hypothetical protein PK095_20755 [Myxococcota bacterium]|nr:hypothetical protein [Myxococcota bacterium]